MNANAIWADEYYAFQHYRGRGQFPMHAIKGKCLRVLKKEVYGGKRARAYVEMEIELGDGSTRIEQVKAQDVVDEWTAYENERNGILRKREEANRIAEETRQRLLKEQEEARRLRQEAAEAALRAETETKERLTNALHNRTQIPVEIVSSISTALVCLDRQMLEFWLSTPDNRGGMSGNDPS